MLGILGGIAIFVVGFMLMTVVAELVARFREKSIEFRMYSRGARRKAMNGNSRGITKDGIMIIGRKDHVKNTKGRKVDRNEPCMCGSGIKSKKCCNLTHVPNEGA